MDARTIALVVGLGLGPFPAPSDAQAAAAPAERPEPRWGHALVWDPFRREVVLFGGAREPGAYLGDTWTFDGERWEQHHVEAPPARGFAAAAFHEARGTIVLHGGRAEGRRPHTDTWEWDGERWELVDEDGFGADHHAMVYLPEEEQLLLFGGWDGSGVSGDTWIFGESWRRVPGPSPPPRSAFGMTYDRARGAAVLYGGLWIEGQYADVWEWRDGAWGAVTGPYDNSSLDHHSLVFDPDREEVVGFGGKNYRYVLQERTFTFGNGRVRERARVGPGARHSTPLAWDGTSGRVLLFGGKQYVEGEMKPLGDLWAWDGTGWARADDGAR